MLAKYSQRINQKQIHLNPPTHPHKQINIEVTQMHTHTNKHTHILNRDRIYICVCVDMIDIPIMLQTIYLLPTSPITAPNIHIKKLTNYSLVFILICFVRIIYLCKHKYVIHVLTFYTYFTLLRVRVRVIVRIYFIVIIIFTVVLSTSTVF